jgi:hypothetical protein
MEIKKENPIIFNFCVILALMDCVCSRRLVDNYGCGERPGDWRLLGADRPLIVVFVAVLIPMALVGNMRRKLAGNAPNNSA